MQTWQIHIQGRVQGVGFRPFVLNAATTLSISGFVRNEVDGVYIVFNGDEAKSKEFQHYIQENKPLLALITSSSLTKSIDREFNDFQIRQSTDEAGSDPIITPDFAVCRSCKTEIENYSDKRFNYPFTSCTNCGPRYSIIRAVPYDRANTTMHRFVMCNPCRDEYMNPLNKRHHAQTNSCPDCKIELTFSKHGKHKTCKSDQVIQEVCNAWEQGMIVAIKGIGGYLLTCNMADERAIHELRKRKHRFSKPFAVMYPDISYLKNDFDVRVEEEEVLTGSTAPIILLQKSEHCQVPEAIAPGLGHIGVMLPYTPFYHLLLRKFQKPIVATSANYSNTPIIYDDGQSEKQLEKLAVCIVSHNLQITIPQDDSVTRITEHTSTPILIRRSRGLAPSLIIPELEIDPGQILATGAILKSTFTIQSGDKLYTSQYIGDLASYDTEVSYRHTLNHLLYILKSKPEAVLCDLHPNYPSSRMAHEFAEQYNVDLIVVQHHLAHFSAILGEYNLLSSNQAILGIVWDGMGLGEDNNIWGGECFTYFQNNFERRFYLEYFNNILGDKMAKEPRISAFSLFHNFKITAPIFRKKFSDSELAIYEKKLQQKDMIQSSSIGRLFDAVASILDLCNVQSYEGEAAMYLEQLATKYISKNGMDSIGSYWKDTINDEKIPTSNFFNAIVTDVIQQEDKGRIAANFHRTLVDIIRSVAIKLEIKTITFSGGVFQNALLVDMIHHFLGHQFQLYFHKHLPPNDENISFGQLIYHHISKRGFYQK